MIKMLYNPFDMIFEAIKRVCDVEATLIFVREEDCDEAWGFMQKNDDGSFTIAINSKIPLEHSLEVIAHEAAHIMAKSNEKQKGAEHDEEWEMWFDNINREYMQIYIETISRKKGSVKI